MSCLPPSNLIKHSLNSTSMLLFAVNGSPIRVYGQITHELDLCLCRPFMWNFIVADVTAAIIGADFLRHHDLMVDLKRSRLIDSRTQIASKTLASITSHEPSPQIINRSTPFADIVLAYPKITHLAPPGISTNSNAVHYVETSGPPCSARARRLPQDKLNAEKKEFELLMRAGICRPSKSNWSSPLHMVRKPDGSWRPCEDYKSPPQRFPIDIRCHICTTSQIYCEVNLYFLKSIYKRHSTRCPLTQMTSQKPQ